MNTNSKLLGKFDNYGVSHSNYVKSIIDEVIFEKLETDQFNGYSLQIAAKYKNAPLYGNKLFDQYSSLISLDSIVASSVSEQSKYYLSSVYDYLHSDKLNLGKDLFIDFLYTLSDEINNDNNLKSVKKERLLISLNVFKHSIILWSPITENGEAYYQNMKFMREDKTTLSLRGISPCKHAIGITVWADGVGAFGGAVLSLGNPAAAGYGAARGSVTAALANANNFKSCAQK